jgi:hypothetical protein
MGNAAKNLGVEYDIQPLYMANSLINLGEI